MPALRPVRGTHDLIGDELRRHRAIAETCRDAARRYGYTDIATPIFEFTEVFARSLGDSSDVVAKEMYTFEDRGGERITLRPENTAGVVRAFLSAGLQQNLPQRLFYYGPMFRYERPQKGRLRQFHQIGVELIGAAEPLADVEVIALGARMLRALGLANVTLELNSLGDVPSRQAYRTQLVDYLRRHKSDLSEDSRARLARNPLRILDSKDAGDRAILQDAPLLADAFTDAARTFFAQVRDGLDRLGIAYTLNPQLVRGLDYYGHTAFEFTSSDLGAQSAVLAGGRYDGLVEQLGGPSVPGVGFAAGVERLALLAAVPETVQAPLAVVPMDDDQQNAALLLAEELRDAGYSVDLGYRGKPGARLKRANKIGASLALLLGADEVQAGTVTLRRLRDGEQATVARDALIAQIQRFTDQTTEEVAA